MFRSFFIYLSKAAWARRIVTQWGFAWRAASRFISGEKLEDAIQVIRVLNAKKINATLDHLGEHTTNPDEARTATEDILKVFSAIQLAGVRANVSIKLTQIGLALDEGLCSENLLRILQCARDSGSFVRIDMEDSPWVDTTLGLYRKMRFDYGFENVGVVIQSYLFRSEEDIRKIAAEGGRVRLCKGAYKEPPEIAYPKKSDVDESFDRLARILMDGAKMAGSTELSGGGLIPPPTALATHDPQRIEKAKQYAESIGLPKGALEFQMIHGIRRDLQEQLAAQGYPVRVYVPYGTEWYPYFTRRLAERPANVWFFLSNLVRK
jgi:proline dehydrogenase